MNDLERAEYHMVAAHACTGESSSQQIAHAVDSILVHLNQTADAPEPSCLIADEYDKPELTAVEVLQVFNSILPLGDLVYHVRENEGEGWEGPKVKQWGYACEQMQKLLEGK